MEQTLLPNLATLIKYMYCQQPAALESDVNTYDIVLFSNKGIIDATIHNIKLQKYSDANMLNLHDIIIHMMNMFQCIIRAYEYLLAYFLAYVQKTPVFLVAVT